MKKKFLWINLSLGVTLFIVTGLITALIIALPINLTKDEISYYTETAENVWYKGLHSISQDDDIAIKYDLEDKTVRVSGIAPNKQSITVDFSENDRKVTTNKPQTSFIGCFFVYGIFWTLCITFISSMIVGFIQEYKKLKTRK